MTVTTDRFETNVIINETDNFIEVWSDRRGCFFRIDRDEFLNVWWCLHQTWIDPVASKALRFGSGRDTLAGWVRKASMCRFNPEYLRIIIEIGIALEWVIPSRNASGHSVFNLRPIRYEHLL